MAEDKISEYVDRTGFSSDTKFILDELNTIYAAFKKLDEIKIDLSKSLGLAQIIPLSKEANTQITAMVDSATKLHDATKSAADGMATYTAAAGKLSNNVKENIQQQIVYKQRLAEITEELKKLKSAQQQLVNLPGNEKAKKDIEDRIFLLSEEQAQTKLLSQELVRFTNTQIKQAQATSGTLKEMRAELTNLQNFRDTKLVVGTEDFDKANLKILELTGNIKKQEAAGGDFRRNVGNYAGSLASAFDKVSQEIARLKVEQQGLQDLSKRNPIGFAIGGQEQLNKVTASLQQLEQVQVSGFKATANHTTQVRSLENAYISLATNGDVSNEFLREFKNAIGDVKDDVNDLRASINLAASDTRGLDILIGGAQAVAGAFGIAQGAAAAFGDNNENLQRTLVKLNGVMTLLNGLQAIQGELKKKDNILTVAQIGLQKAYTTVIGTSTGALKIFKIALLATGIGILVFGLIEAAKAMGIFGKSTSDSEKDMEAFNKVLERQNSLLDDNVRKIDTATKLRLLRAKELGKTEANLFGITLLGLVKQQQEQERAANKSIQLVNKQLTMYGLVVTGRESAEAALLDIQKRGDAKVEAALKDSITNFRAAEDTKNQILVTKAEFRVSKADQVREKEKKSEEDATQAAEEQAQKRAEIQERNRKAQFEIDTLPLERSIKTFQEITDNEKNSFGVRLLALADFNLATLALIDQKAAFEKGKTGLTTKEIELIEKKSLDDRYQALQDYIQKVAELRKTVEDPEKALQEQGIVIPAFKATLDALLKINDENNEKQLDADKELAERKKELYKQLYTEIAGLAFDFLKADFDRQKNLIQEQIDLLERKKQKDIEVANQSITNAEDRANAIIVIEARANAQREQLEARKRQLDIQRARFEKAESIASIIMNTAEAVVKVLDKPALIPIIIAIGAAQLARVIATPIPKFRHGKNVNDLYEGPAIVGDGGKKELIIRENGRTEVTPATAALTYLKKRDIVLPDADMAMRHAAVSMHNQIQNIQGNQVQVNQSENVVSEIKAMRKDVVSAIKNKPEPHYTVENLIRKRIRSGSGSWTEFINRIVR